MSSLFRNLNSAAIDAKLNKNELLIFNALMSQTLGFGKCSDPLTDKRLAALTGIRLDRLRPTLKRFLKRDIFFRVEHKRYDYEYCIAEHFFDDRLNKKVYTPNYLASGSSDKKPLNLTTHGGFQPAERGHTTTNLTEIQKKPPQPTKTNTGLTEKKPEIQTPATDLKKPPPQKTEINLKKPPPPKQTQNPVDNKPCEVIEIFMGGLNQLPEQFVIQSSASVRIEFSSNNMGINTNAIAPTQQQETIPQAVTEISVATAEPSALAPMVKTKPLVASSDSTDTLDKPHSTLSELPAVIEMKSEKPQPQKQVVKEAEITKNIPISIVEADNTTPNPVVVVDKKEDEKPQLTVPKMVGEVNYNACHKKFQQLNHQQQKNVLLVFEDKVKTGGIRNNANYFVSLIQSAKDDNLTLPTAVMAQQEPSAEQLAACEKRERDQTLWSDYLCLKQFVKLGDEDANIEEVAERLGFIAAYERFGSSSENKDDVEIEQQLAA